MDAFVVEKKPRAGLRSSSQAKLTTRVVAELPVRSDDSVQVTSETKVCHLSSEELEDELRLFDLDNTYGPFVGVERLARWKRAEQMGLSPPQRVLDILSMVPTRVETMREPGRLW